MFAVIDTETTWDDRVMSIGVVVAREADFQALDSKYYVLEPECQIGGMYENALFPESVTGTIRCTRREAVEDLRCWLASYGIKRIFAYNASFDRGHLPELRQLVWHDIMRLAAYRQHNRCIPAGAPCCSTGRLKKGYGVEAMLRLLSRDGTYRETHNALLDAADELRIMALLGHGLNSYIPMG